MTNKTSPRRLTVRELVLMIFLIAVLFIGLYFWLVYYPIRDRIAELRQEQDTLELRMTVAEAREQIYNEMKAELDEILEEEAPTRMPPFDNITNLTDSFAEIFKITDEATSSPYLPSINYSMPVLEDGIYERTVRFSFRCYGYDSAKEVLLKLLRTGYRCLMTSLSLSPEGNGNVQDNVLTVNTVIVFYELA